MPILFYQIIHVATIILLAGSAVGLIISKHKKPFNIAYGVLSTLVLIAGFGLIAKLGYSFKEQAWLTIKLLIWTLLAVGLPIVVKRQLLSERQSLLIVYSLFIIAVFMVYGRPV